MGTQSAQSDRSWHWILTVLAGGVLGVFSFWLGYGLTYLLKADGIRDAVGSDNSLGAGAWQLVGWLYMGMHTVPIDMKRTRLDVPSGSTTAERSVVESATTSMTSSPSWEWWLVVVVPLFLLLAGYALTFHRDISAGRGAKVGATLVLGYLPFVALTTLLFRVQSTQHTGCSSAQVMGGPCSSTTTIGPDPILALLVAGVLYPVLFGSIGGVLGAKTSPLDAVAGTGTVGQPAGPTPNESGPTEYGDSPPADGTDRVASERHDPVSSERRDRAAETDGQAAGGERRASVLNFCPDCGTELGGSPVYCPTCGIKLEDVT